MIVVDDILRETVQKLYNVYFWPSKLIKFFFDHQYHVVTKQ